jgi:Transposase DDE domain
LLESLAGLRKAGEFAEWPVWILPGQARSSSGRQRIAGRVCAIRKSRDAIERAKRRLKDKEQKGKNVGPANRKYAEYVLVFTTLPASEASTEQVLEAYPLRWQVELTFERLKSIAQLGHVQARFPEQQRLVVRQTVRGLAESEDGTGRKHDFPLGLPPSGCCGALRASGA